MSWLPRYDDKRGRWWGGDHRTLYKVTDPLTKTWRVLPGGSASLIGCGPQAVITIATRAEAESVDDDGEGPGWQKPLHKGWIVAD